MVPKNSNRSKKRVEYVVRIGPELMAIMQILMKRVKEYSYDVTKISTWEASEMIARKVKGII